MSNMSYIGRALISFGKQKTMPMSVTVNLQSEQHSIEGIENVFIITWGGTITNISFDTGRMMIGHVGEIINIKISKNKEGQARLDFVSFRYRENETHPPGVDVRITGINKPPYSHLEK